MKPKQPSLEIVPVEELIRIIRGQRVILDADLARAYGVPTKRLNEAVKRSPERFPPDFAFTLEPQEVASLRSQCATASQPVDSTMRSQTVTASKRNIRFRPWAFTEHGAIMAANVLNSSRAVQMSVFVVRAFVKMREALAQNKELSAKLAELENKLTARLDDHEQAIVAILDEIKKLMKPVFDPEPKRREIGFHVRDENRQKLGGSRSNKVPPKLNPGTSSRRQSEP